MAKFTGSNMSLTFATNTITCLQSVETSETADVQEIECAGASAKEVVVGLNSITMSVTGALEETDDTLLGYFAPGTNGTVTFNPAGGAAASGNITITSNSATVTDRTTSTAVNGFGQYGFTLRLDDISIGGL